MKPSEGFSWIGIGPAPELGLRVSVAALARVVFRHPETNQLMLVLERKATFREIEKTPNVEVISQPFGGAIRIKDGTEIKSLLRNFHFDSEQSKSEGDFRLFIRPEEWPRLRKFTVEHLKREDDTVLETSPERELAEEFKDALGIDLHKDQYQIWPVGINVDDHQAPTRNPRAEGYPTVRVYRISEVMINDTNLIKKLLENSSTFTDDHLRQDAKQDAQKGGKGRANGVTVLSMEKLNEHFRHLQISEKGSQVYFIGAHLDKNVRAIL